MDAKYFEKENPIETLSDLEDDHQLEEQESVGGAEVEYQQVIEVDEEENEIQEAEEVYTLQSNIKEPETPQKNIGSSPKQAQSAYTPEVKEVISSL